MSNKPKNKTTLMTGILKVEGNNVVLIFWLEDQRPSLHKSMQVYPNLCENQCKFAQIYKSFRESMRLHELAKIYKHKNIIYNMFA